jgi:hypothetical protein
MHWTLLPRLRVQARRTPACGVRLGESVGREKNNGLYTVDLI